MKDEKLTACPTEGCNGQVKRLLGTGGGILFKGKGFYQTDYRSSSYHADSKADAGAAKSDTPAAAPGTAAPGTAAPSTTAPTKTATKTAE